MITETEIIIAGSPEAKLKIGINTKVYCLFSFLTRFGWFSFQL
jgi:hypothetical protein